jgi:hypothetical protein
MAAALSRTDDQPVMSDVTARAMTMSLKLPSSNRPFKPTRRPYQGR